MVQYANGDVGCLSGRSCIGAPDRPYERYVALGIDHAPAMADPFAARMGALHGLLSRPLPTPASIARDMEYFAGLVAHRPSRWYAFRLRVLRLVSRLLRVNPEDA